MIELSFYVHRKYAINWRKIQKPLKERVAQFLYSNNIYVYDNTHGKLNKKRYKLTLWPMLHREENKEYID